MRCLRKSERRSGADAFWRLPDTSPGHPLALYARMLLACPICKILHLGRGLCAVCAGRLWARRQPTVRREEGFNIRSLFSWERDQYPALAWWVRALKGVERNEFWREPALWALATFPAPRGTPQIVPVPSAKARNHALGFARALARLTGWPLAQPLTPTTPAEQKRLDREQRARRTFTRTGDLYTNVLLVDDVVTTGSTCRAAWTALSPGTCEAWCLLDRRSCGAPKPLL